MLFSLTALASLAAISTAMQVDQPIFDGGGSSELDLTVDNRITWSTVRGDQKYFSIFLTNYAQPPVHGVNECVLIAEDVDASKRYYDIKANSVKRAVRGGYGYEIRFHDTNSCQAGIITQTGTFDALAYKPK